MSEDASLPASRCRSVRILGIDPGSQRTGVGIIDIDAGGKLSHVWHGALVVLGEDGFPARLKRI
ncbi:MAG TPA: crossover junction endodeoxyribonuclease RuvC, partial [Rhodanobacteraceae bacterium]|nr:crossover junction endodeoxyribonuclease RuvC [Rhodanobacteraceae bacterium]